MPALLKTYYDLCKVPISFAAACSAALGYFLAPSPHHASTTISLAGVFLLACGTSALNQVQEKDIDGKMERTRSRPLPSGLITPVHAVALSLLLATAGLFLIVTAGGWTAALFGLLAVLWYNGVYTHLKRITAFASLPGALVGAIPPAIGWVSAGGLIVDPRLLSLCTIFFLWQVPHFWILILHHGKEYENAGLPSLTRVMSRPQIARITYVWIFAAAVATLLLPLYGVVRSPVLYVAFIPSAAWLVWSGRSLAARRPVLASFPLLFRKINIYLFLIMSLLVLENIFFNMP